MDIEELDFGDVLEIHQKYQELESLTATCEWLAETRGIKTTRFKLSPLFKTHGLDVKPPNGRDIQHWVDDTQYATIYGEFAGVVLRGIWQDIYNYVNTGTGLCDYISACVSLTGPLYEAVMGTIKQGSKLSIDATTLPPQITPEIVTKGVDIYEQAYKWWVIDLDDAKFFSN